MASIAAFVADATMVVIFLVVLVMGLCAIKIALGISTDTHRIMTNKYVVPGFPCDGTLFLLARDGVMYVVPAGKAVVSTDMVREVHCGRVARGCDQHGRFTYCDENENENEDRGQNAVDHINSHWSGSVRSQSWTLSVSDDDSYRASPPDSPLAGEMTTHETLMI